jgi:hypothetical protein
MSTPDRWKGEAVEDRPGDAAERAADRAEGNAPIPVADERVRAREPSAEEQPERARRRAPHTDDPDEEIEQAAEEHRALRATGERPPRGKL